MLLDELLSQDDGKEEKIKDVKFTEFSQKTVRFGDSIYQLKNVTGFTIGVLEKRQIQWTLVVILIAIGVASLVIVVGIVPLGIAGWMIYSHYTQVQEYGFTLELNSGKKTSFISSDKQFLGQIVSELYRLMEGDIDSLTVNWFDRSLQVSGDVKGILATGDRANIQQNYSE